MAKTIKKEEELEVRVGLGEEEREPLTKDLLSELAETESLEKEAKQTAATYRKQINDRKKKIIDLRTTLEQGKPEMRPVIAHYNFSAGVVKYEAAEREGGEGPLKGMGKFYKDKQREVTDDDRQMKIGEKDLESSEEEKD